MVGARGIDGCEGSELSGGDGRADEGSGKGSSPRDDAESSREHCVICEVLGG